MSSIKKLDKECQKIVEKCKKDDPRFTSLYDLGREEKNKDSKDLDFSESKLLVLRLCARVALYTEDKEKIKSIFSSSTLSSTSKVPLSNDLLLIAIQEARKHPEYRIKKELEKTKDGKIANSLLNVLKIYREDPRIPPIKTNLFNGIIAFDGTPPWPCGASVTRELDSGHDAALDEFVNIYYGFDPSQKNRERAIIRIGQENSFHPIKDILDKLPEWDGEERVESLFVDYIGAEDSSYTRAVAKYSLSAAYQRIYKPGIKWECVPILIGDQGIGKSTLLAKVAIDPDFFTDSLTMDKMKPKEGGEVVKSAWFVELSELAGKNKSEDEQVKQFISATSDKYREPYEKQAKSHPRQCVFFGTSNQREGLLRDITGNRRFLPIYSIQEPTLKSWDLDLETVLQMWAEVKAKWADLSLKLPKDIEEAAREQQAKATIQDPDVAIVKSYLEMKVPENWENESIIYRKAYFENYYTENDKQKNSQGDSIEKIIVGEKPDSSILKPMDKTCLYEIWVCALDRNWESRKSQNQAVAIMSQLRNWESLASKEEYKGNVKEMRRQVVYRRVE